MAVILGHSGDVTIGATALKVREWSADISAEKVDTTSMASGEWRDHVVGIKMLEGSATALWDAAFNGSAPPYATVFPQNGASFSLALGDNAGGGTITFTGIIEKLSIKAAFEGAIEYSFDFTSSGTVTFTP